MAIQYLHVLTLLLFTALSSPTAFAKTNGLRANLIHRASVRSPSYNSSSPFSSYDHAKNSIARFEYLMRRQTTKPNEEQHDYRAPVQADQDLLIYSANVSVGEPPVPQVLLMDTASSLLWFQCLPCIQCFDQSFPIFYPSKSSTFAYYSCDNPHCSGRPCDSSNKCLFEIAYYDGTASSGFLASEKLTFETSDDGIISVSDVSIGCSNKGFDRSGKHSGILGLYPADKDSVVPRSNYKFSHCINDLFDPNYLFNNLILGDGAIIQGQFSPLETFGGRYFVSLEGISLGLGNRLDIDPNIFKKVLGSADGGMFIDSGTTLSLLPRNAYEQLCIAMDREMDGKFEHTESKFNPMCYKGNIKRDIQSFPPMIFHFTGDAALEQDQNSIFYQRNDTDFCLAVLEAPADLKSGVIGIMAQQYYNIGFDLLGKQISFLGMEDCRNLEVMA